MIFRSSLVGAALVLCTLHLQGAAPPNDNFANATLLAGTNLTVSATNAGATKETGEPEHGADPGGKSVWWRWTAPDSGSVVVTTDGSSFDTTLAAYTGNSVANLASTASNDDAIGAKTSIIGFDVHSGTNYYIAVDGYSGDAGTIQLRLTFSPASLPRPINDNFADALPLAGSSALTLGTNLFATLEPGEPEPGDAPTGASIWWTWTAPLSGDVTIQTVGSDVDTILGVYTGSTLTNLLFVAANDDISTNQATSRVLFHALANTRYNIVVDGYDGEPGDIHLGLEMDLPGFSLSSPRSTADGGHTLVLTGQPAQRYTLEASPDLRTWKTVATLPADGSGNVNFIDPPISVQSRFYRAALGP